MIEDKAYVKRFNGILSLSIINVNIMHFDKAALK